MGREIKAINVEVGSRIKQFRMARKLTRAELAELVGYSSHFIQEVERGRSGLSSESIKAFSTGLGVSADALLFGEEADQHNYFLRKISAVPPEKMKHIWAILDEAIECSK